MGYRLSKIYTRTGDTGSTGLGNGARVTKDDLRVEAFGTVDELNSQIGLALTTDLPDQARPCLSAIQHELFDLGGELCIPGHTIIEQDYIDQLEQWLDELNSELPPLEEFILPGGNAAAATCHVARTVCRRAERRLTSLAQHEEINPYALSYLNRLSDLLFVIARHAARANGQTEIRWRQRQKV